MSNSIHLEHLLASIVDCLSLDGAAKIANLRADVALQARINHLAECSNEGLLTDAERNEYAGYLQAIDVIAVLQAKARAIKIAERIQ